MKKQILSGINCGSINDTAGGDTERISATCRSKHRMTLASQAGGATSTS